MVFQSKRPSEDNQVLPGGGLEIDLDRRMCPSCRRETPPWEERCRECGADTVPPEQAPAPQFRLPHLEDEVGPDDGPTDDDPTDGDPALDDPAVDDPTGPRSSEGRD